jgi:protein-tyrosine phosphatase
MKLLPKNTYWVIPDHFLVGSYPGSMDNGRAKRKVDSICKLGIKLIIDLTEIYDGSVQGALKPYHHFLNDDVRYKKIPVTDRLTIPANTMRNILDAIDHSLGENLPVYLHCRGGKYRSGIVVGAYLIRHGYATNENVFKKIHELRKNSNLERIELLPEQKETVLNWEYKR